MMSDLSGVITSAPVPLTAADQVVSMIEELKVQMQTQAPGYESMLHRIHTILSKDDNLAYLLTEEQIGVIVSGLSKKKNVVLASTTTKKKSMKNLSLDDL